MVCKELKMNFNAAFVHNYPLFTRVLLRGFFFFLLSLIFFLFAKQIGEHFVELALSLSFSLSLFFPCEERI